MYKYYIEFSKIGNIKYISHLDMQRLFKRAFKSCGIPIEYSQGYNPHPKMGFAQPLSLGYTASKEYIEFETTEKINALFALDTLRNAMPQGIELLKMAPLEELINEFKINPQKSLAASVVSAVYSVFLPIPFRFRHEDVEKLVSNYLAQPEIMAKKREKKTKKIVDKNIKNQIRSIKVVSSKSQHFSNNEESILSRNQSKDADSLSRNQSKDVDSLSRNQSKDIDSLSRNQSKDTDSLLSRDSYESVDENRKSFTEPENSIVLLMELDSGSTSNLSPEQVISSFTEFSGLYLPREDIEVNRDYMTFSN